MPTYHTKNLPLLSFASSLFPNADFSNVLVIACQHLLGTTIDLFEELFKQGLSPKNVYLLGKCYSSNETVFSTLKKKGVNVSRASFSFDGHRSFDEQFQECIEDFCKQIKEDLSTFDKVVILDDGGKLLQLARGFFKSKNIIGVEQTSSGFHFLNKNAFDFPIVNVARSKAKLEVESPMIAELVVGKTEKYLRKHGIKKPSVLVVGAGALGSQVIKLLKQNYNVHGCDTVLHQCDFKGSYKENLSKFDIIIGATGQTILDSNDLKKMKHPTVLISISSSDREFPAAYLRKQSLKSNDCHRNVVVGTAILVNGGFPINFDGEIHSLAPEKIQFTRALLLAGIYQALKTNPSNKGLQELDNQVQEKIIENFSSALSVSTT